MLILSSGKHSQSSNLLVAEWRPWLPSKAAKEREVNLRVESRSLGLGLAVGFLIRFGVVISPAHQTS